MREYCEGCGKARKLGGGWCASCNEKRGLRWCAACKSHLLVNEDFFYFSKDGRPHGHCRACISKKNKTGRKVGRDFAVPSDKREWVRAQYESGRSMISIGRELDVSQSAVRRLLLSLGVKFRSDAQFAHKLNQDFFACIDTEEKAYWLGFLATDGNVYGSRIQINLAACDRGHLEKFRTSLGLTAPIKDRLKKVYSPEYKKNEYRLVSVAFRSKKMVRDLLAHGLGPKKSFTVRPWGGPEHLLRHYWRGVVDGDGCIGKKNPEGTRFVISLVGNEYIVTGFRDFVDAKLKFCPSVSPKRKIFKVDYGFNASKNVAELLYSNCAISLERKQALAQRLMQMKVRAQRELNRGRVQQKRPLVSQLVAAQDLPVPALQIPVQGNAHESSLAQPLVQKLSSPV